MRPTKILALVMLAVSSLGCQVGVPVQQEQPEPQAAETTTQQTTAPSTAPTPVATSTAPPDKVLASREGTFESEKFRIDVVQLLRRERFVNLTFTATVLEEGAPLGWQVNNAFAAVPNPHPTVDGVYLVDVKNAKKHLVALDSEGNCVCTRVEGLFIKKDDTAVFAATFAAPPADVTTVDVHIPTVGTLADVPIA